MVENLREVIARLKNQQSPKPIETPKVVPVEVDPDPIEDEEDFINEEQEAMEETPKVKEKEIARPINTKNSEGKENIKNSEIEQHEALIQQIEALQNNGVFRLEMLAQLEEIKRALTVIAGVLVDLNGKK